MRIESFVCNPFQEHCYVLWEDGVSSCLIVDPGFCNHFEWDLVHQFLTQHGLVPERVLVTHNHSDHVMGTGYVAKAYPEVEVCGSVEDQDHLPPVYLQNRLFGVDTDVNPWAIGHDLHEGDVLYWPMSDSSTVPQTRIEVLDCPGHSHHGLCYYFPDCKVLMSGDVLFSRSIGRSDFGPAMGGNGKLLVESIVSKLLPLPADVKVYPGHGPTTTIGEENTYNPYF